MKRLMLATALSCTALAAACMDTATQAPVPTATNTSDPAHIPISAAPTAAVTVGEVPMAAPGDAAPGPVPTEIADCSAQGGTMQPVGLGGHVTCVIPYKDAEKDCTDDSDCQGVCWISEIAPPAADGFVHGQCQATNQPFGCHAIIQKGKIVGGVMCID